MSHLKLIMFAVIPILGFTGPAARAAVAPQYDRLLQFQAVLSDQVVEALGERPIDRIKRRKNGTFDVWSGVCLVTVTLNAIPPKDGMVGRTDYEIAEVSRIACQ